MRHVLAFFCPWLSFFTIGKPGRGILCLMLQITIVGWLPAVIWAFSSVGAYNADKRTDRLVDAIAKNNPNTRPSPSASPIPEYVPPVRAAEPVRPLPTVESHLRSRPGASVRTASPLSGQPTNKGVATQERSYDERKWRALLRFDDEISAAAERARSFGPQWEDELARSYLRLNDKSYLDVLIDKIAKDARAQSA